MSFDTARSLRSGVSRELVLVSEDSVFENTPGLSHSRAKRADQRSGIKPCRKNLFGNSVGNGQRGSNLNE